jgi:hypothetical protein
MTVTMLRALERRGAGWLEVGLIGAVSSDSFKKTSKYLQVETYTSGCARNMGTVVSQVISVA